MNDGTDGGRGGTRGLGFGVDVIGVRLGFSADSTVGVVCGEGREGGSSMGLSGFGSIPPGEDGATTAMEQAKREKRGEE